MNAKLCAVAIFVVVAAGAGCGDLTTIKVPAESSITVPGQDILGGNPLAADQVFPSAALSEALAKALQQSFDTSGYDKDAIDSLTLTKLSMTVKDPQQGNRQIRGLGFIEKLTVSVSTDGVAPIIAAESADGVFAGNPGPASYEMPLTGTELVSLFQAGDSLDMTADLEPGEPPNFATTVDFETELTIKVNIGGVLNGSES